MKHEILDRLKRELDDWRARVDELRVKASLGKMELRDRGAELERGFEKARAEAEKKLAEVKQSGGEELGKVAKSLEAGWAELRRTYADLHKAKE